MIDHVGLAKSRIISEYRGKQAFEVWATIGPEISNRQQVAIDKIIRSYDVDTVNDELLNIIGRIVGVNRPIIRVTTTDVFGYDGNDSYTNYNDAPYIGDGASTVDAPLSNDLYRKLIKAKIARNISDATYDSIIQLATFILGFPVTALIDYGDMSFQLGFDREPDNSTKFLIDNFDVIPKPQAVRMREYFILPQNIDEIERTSSLIYQYANFTLPGDVA